VKTLNLGYTCALYFGCTKGLREFRKIGRRFRVTVILGPDGYDLWFDPGMRDEAVVR